MTTTLITGANKGLGFETARRLRAIGHDVWVGARDTERGRTAAAALGARFVQLDVTDDASVTAAAATVAETGLDVLINNAGILGRHGVDLRELTADDLVSVFDTNTFGPFRVTQAFLPLLVKSRNPVIVNVSSTLGSLALMSDTEGPRSSIVSLTYAPSKSALNMLTTMYAKAYPELRINAVDPGYTATEGNNMTGHQTLEEGTDAIVALATVGADGPTATFSDRHGAVPW